MINVMLIVTYFRLKRNYEEDIQSKLTLADIHTKYTSDGGTGGVALGWYIQSLFKQVCASKVWLPDLKREDKKVLKSQFKGILNTLFHIVIIGYLPHILYV